VPLTPSGEIGRYDTLLALFGTGSYLSDEELERIPLLLRPGGRAVVMFYAAGCVPHTTVETSGLLHRSWLVGLFPGDLARVGHQIVCVYEKP
jgi:hypothetical protein